MEDKGLDSVKIMCQSSLVGTIYCRPSYLVIIELKLLLCVPSKKLLFTELCLSLQLKKK